MTPRSHSKSVVFGHPFELKGVGRIVPAGDYRVVTDEELIEELSFPVYRRISTMIFLPGQGREASSLEMVTIDPRDLEAAQDRDRATNQLPAGNADRSAKGPTRLSKRNPTRLWAHGHDRQSHRYRSVSRGMRLRSLRLSVDCWRGAG